MSLPMRRPVNSMEFLLLRLRIASGLLKGDGIGRVFDPWDPACNQNTTQVAGVNSIVQCLQLPGYT